MPSSQSYRVRRGTAAQWSAANPVLAAGEPGYETDTGNFKVGNGTSTWAALAVSGGPSTFVNRTTRTQHATSLGLYFPEAEGAAANGTTDDATAINAALTAAGSAGTGARVILSPGKTYALGSQLTVPAGVTLEGRATLKMLAAATSRAILVQDVSDVNLYDFTIDLNKAATTDGGSTTQQQGVYVNANAAAVARVKVQRVRIINGWQRGISVVAASGQTINDIDIDACLVSSIGHVGIYVSAVGNADKVTASTSTRIRVRNCSVLSPGTGGIQLIGVSDATVANNFCDGATTATGQGICMSTTGTAVQVTDFSITGNVVRRFSAATRWGIVVSTNCTRFTIAENVVTDCAGGITVDPEDGSAVGVVVPVAATITGNTVKGSLSSHGINIRLSENATLAGNTSVGSAGGSGIAVANAVSVVVTGNALSGNSSYGVAVQGTNAGTGGHVVGPNVAVNNTSGAFSTSSPPVACTYQLGTRDVKQAADLSVTSSVTTVSSSLALGLDSGAEYEFEAFLVYDGGTTGDIRTAFTFPAGATYYWSTMGPTTTATGTPATMVTSGAESAGGVSLNGAIGVGSTVLVRVIGYVTTAGSSGTLQHKFAQSVADVTATTLKSGSRMTVRRIS